MFGLGATELIVILVLALVLLGPSKLPQAAASLGKAIRQFRKATRDLGSQLDIDDEVKQPFRELRAAMRDEPAPYVAPAPPANTVAATPVAASSGIEPAKPGQAQPEVAAAPADDKVSDPAPIAPPKVG
jgi:sec-independent protein translocase protein TatB